MQAWTCIDRTSPSPTSPPLGGPATVEVKVGQDCAVTSWASPYPTQQVSVTVSHSPGVVTLTGVDGPPRVAVGLHFVAVFMLAGLAVVIAMRSASR